MYTQSCNHKNTQTLGYAQTHAASTRNESSLGRQGVSGSQYKGTVSYVRKAWRQALGAATHNASAVR